MKKYSLSRIYTLGYIGILTLNVSFGQNQQNSPKESLNNVETIEQQTKADTQDKGIRTEDFSLQKSKFRIILSRIFKSANVNTKPTASDDNKSTAEDVALHAVLLASDADGDVLTFTKASDPIHGTVVVQTDGSYIYTPEQNYAGPDFFSIMVDDGNGGTKTARVFITVVAQNDAPIVTNESVTILEDFPLNGTVSATDVESDALSYTEASAPSHGTLIVNNDATYVYTPSQDFYGPDFFYIAVNDGNGGVTNARVDVSVTAVNDNPQVADVSLVMNENGVLNNSVGATDPDGDALSYSKGFEPFYGTLELQANGSYTYTPNHGFTGNDIFTIDVTDGHGGFSTVTIVVGVGLFNDLPVVNDMTVTVLEDRLLSATLSATDPEGEALTFSLGTNPSHGTAVVNEDGTFTYTPSQDYSGSDEFTILVTDARGGVSPSKVSVTVEPDADNDGVVNPLDPDDDNDGVPDGVDAFPLDPTESIDTDLDGVGNNADSDDDNDGVADATDVFPLDKTEWLDTDLDGRGNNIDTDDDNDKYPDSVEILAATNPLDSGSVPTDTDQDGLANVVDPDDDNDGEPDGTDVFPLDPAESKDTDIDAIGNNADLDDDADGFSDTAELAAGTNPLDLNSKPDFAVNPATTPENEPLSGTVMNEDPYGDKLIYSLKDQPGHGTVTLHGDGTYTYAPSTNFNGNDRFTVWVTNKNGGATAVVVPITVVPVNENPVVVDDLYRISEAHEPIVLTPLSNDTDADNDVLKLLRLNGVLITPGIAQSISVPGGALTVSVDGTISFNPGGAFNERVLVPYTISDGNGGTAMGTITILQDLFVPDAFSPNGDGVNEVLEILHAESVSVDLYVYNRWGGLVYESKNYQNTWDGTGLSNQALPQGSYYRIVVMTNMATGQVTKSASYLNIRR